MHVSPYLDGLVDGLALVRLPQVLRKVHADRADAVNGCDQDRHHLQAHRVNPAGLQLSDVTQALSDVCGWKRTTISPFWPSLQGTGTGAPTGLASGLAQYSSTSRM